MSEVATGTLTAEQARGLEARFLTGLEDAQFAYERIVASQAWLTLGFDSFAAWWDERIRPAMHALSMRPTKEIAAAVVEQVRAEEAELPPAWRRTQQELADMVGVGEATVGRLAGTRSSVASSDAGRDLDEPPVAMPARQDVADAILDQIDRRQIAQPERPRPIPLTVEELRESERRAAIANLRSVLTYLVSTAIAPTELARDYAVALDEFKQDDLNYAAATMTAIADLKEQ